MSEWREKSEAGAEQIRKMNAKAMESQEELELVKKKLAAMEKLNRTLQKERSELLKTDKK